MNSDPSLSCLSALKTCRRMSLRGIEGCVVKSSRYDVKQAHAGASPQHFKTKWNTLSSFVSLFSTGRLLSFHLSPFARFINVILDIIYIMYVRDLHARPHFGSVSRPDTASVTRGAAEPWVWPRRCELRMHLKGLKTTSCSSPLWHLFSMEGCTIV